MPRLQTQQIEYLALEGGGAKGTGYIGALCALSDLGILPCNNCDQIKGISGTSIGAIVGMCIALGYSPEEINARLVRDRAFSLLHAEPYRSGMFRTAIKKAGVAQRGSSSVKLASTSQARKPNEKLIDLKKAGNFLQDKAVDFAMDWLKQTLVAILADNRLITEYLYTGGIEAIRDNKAFIGQFAAYWDIIQMVGHSIEDLFDDGFLNDNNSNGEFDFSNLTVTQFLNWLDSDPFHTGDFSSESSRKDKVIGFFVSVILLAIIIFIFLSLFGKNRDVFRNKWLLLKIIVSNFLFNTTHPSAYIGLTQLKTRLKKASVNATTGMLADPKNNEAISQSLLDELTNIAKDFLGSDTFDQMMKSIVTDGGLWSGIGVRVILGEMIYGKIEVVEEKGEKIFNLRKDPINWDNEEDRLSHPGLVTPNTRYAKKQFREKYRALETVTDEKSEKSPRRRARQAVKTPKAKREKMEQDLLHIINNFTYKDLQRLFKIDFTTTGTNITTNTTVYFNPYITPDMPLVDGVGISSCFPFLFKPMRLQYVETDPVSALSKNYVKDNWQAYPPKSQKEWFDEHYCGWFVDGGLLNNLPIHAFNGHVSGDSNDKYRSPVNMMDLPLNPNVLALILETFDTATNGSRQHWWKNKHKSFMESKKSPGMLGVIGAVATGASMVHSTTSHMPSAAMQRGQIALIDTDMISLFDLTPIESSLLKVDTRAYKAVYETLAKTLEADWEDALAKKLDRDNKKGRKHRRHISKNQLRRQSRKAVKASR